MVFGRFHCPACNYDNIEPYPSIEFDYVCINCGRTIRYDATSQTNVSFICPICNRQHTDTEFNTCLADFRDNDMDFLLVVI